MGVAADVITPPPPLEASRSETTRYSGVANKSYGFKNFKKRRDRNGKDSSRKVRDHLAGKRGGSCQTIREQLLKIKSLIGNMEDRTKKQKNVSNVIKDGQVEIAGAVEVAMSECDEVDRKEDDRVKSQRSPCKKQEHPTGGTRTIPGRRAEEREEGARTATRRNPERREQREEASQPATSKRRSTSAPLFPEETGDQINDGDVRGRTVSSNLVLSEWRVAKTRKKQRRDENKDEGKNKKGKKWGLRGDKKQSLPRTTRSAVLVKLGVGQSYADVLQKLKTNVNLTETNVEVRGVQKTRDGALLIPLGKGAEDR